LVYCTCLPEKGEIRLLRIENVSFSYKVKKIKKTILEDFSISLQDGENLCICGSSKSGKSSLVYLMSGLKKPDAGKIFFNNIELNLLTKKKLEELRHKEFGFIFREHFLINYLSIRENIMIAAVKRESESKRRFENFCEILGIAEIMDAFPYQLSSAQKHRAAIARALVNSPKILFADEPMAELDCKSQIQLMNLLLDYCAGSGCSVIMTAGDCQTESFFDNKIYLNTPLTCTGALNG